MKALVAAGVTLEPPIATPQNFFESSVEDVLLFLGQQTALHFEQYLPTPNDMRALQRLLEEHDIKRDYTGFYREPEKPIKGMPQLNAFLRQNELAARTYIFLAGRRLKLEQRQTTTS